MIFLFGYDIICIRVRSDNMKHKKISIIITVFLLLFTITGLLIKDELQEIYANYQYKNALSEDRQAVYDKMMIEYVNIKNRITGTAPFNEGTTSNDKGIDVSDTDEYIRTFDVIKYTVELGVSPNTNLDGVTNASTFKGGVIKVRAKIPNQGDLVLMTWEQDAWMQNVTYNTDKTEIYAEYHVPSGISITNANQNLSFTIKIGGYKKEVTSNMAPEFEIWMEGNQPDNATSKAESIEVADTERKTIISAHPSYDIALVKNSYLNQTDIRNNIKGNYYNFNVSLILKQDIAGISDLRGIEYPVGKIELDLDFDYKYNNISDSDPAQTITESTENYNGLANGTELVAYGINGENKSEYYPASNQYTHNRSLPLGSYKVSGGSYDRAVYNSGDFKFSINDDKMHISFENFEFNGAFPLYYWCSDKSSISYGPTEGYFAVGNIELFTPYYNDGLGSYDYTYNINLTNWTYSTLNEKDVTITKATNPNLDVRNSNNSISIAASSRLAGSMYDYTMAMDETATYYLYKNHWNSGDGAVIAGSSFAIRLGDYMRDGPYEGGSDSLLTWDGTKVEFTNFIKNTQYSDLGFEMYSWDNLKIYYGIYKADPINGIDNLEDMNKAVHEDFTWYQTVEEAKANGRISGIFVEDPDNKGYQVVRNYHFGFKSIKNDENIGTTANFRHKFRVYGDKEKKQVYYYLGQSNFTSPTYFKPTKYNADGSISSYRTPIEAGETVLLIGVKSSVNTTVSDKDSNGALKKSYDVGDGEINVKVLPTLSDGQVASASDNYADSVIVTTYLPSGLSYKNGSANKEPKSVTINANGTTTIVWEYKNWQINHAAPDYSNITFTAEIAASLENNTSLEIKSTIFTQQDLRNEKAYRTSNYGVIISNLAGSKVIKTIDKNLLDKNESFSVTNTIGNTSQENLKNAKSIEILPTNGDANGSKFSGTYTVKVLSLADNQKLYYTTKNISVIGLTEDKYGKITIKEVDLGNDDRWIEAKVGDVIPAEATAIATQVDIILPYQNISYTTEILPTNNKQGDVYSFTMNVTSDNLAQAVKSNTVIARVAERKIEGFAFIDVNRNNIYDTGDTLLQNNLVKLLDSNGNQISTTQTDSKGKYVFLNVNKGTYYIEFNIPTNYELITKNAGDVSVSSSANSNNRTDLITGQNSSPNKEIITVENQNLGIRKIDATLTVHHYIEGTTTKLANDQISTVYYGETYTTNIHKDIPNNYELKRKTDNYTGTVNTKTIEVTYYYQKKDSSLETTITKTGPEEVTKKDEIVEYTITYKATTTDYIGNGTITIVDTLPYHIDLEQSNLDNGTYNKETNTITWTIPWNDIDSYTGKGETTITKNISLVYTDLLPTDRIMINSVKGAITLDNNSREIENQTSTNIKIPGKITTYHYLKDTQVSVSEPIVETNLVGEMYTSSQLDLEGYIVTKPEIEEYIFQEEEQNVIYYYEKIKVKVTTLVDGIGGTIAGDEEVEYGNDSTKDKIVVTPDPGYILDSVYVNGKEIELTEEDKYGVTLDNFIGLKEDMNVVVKFLKNSGVNAETGAFANFIYILIIALIITVRYLKIKKSKIIKIN